MPNKEGAFSGSGFSIKFSTKIIFSLIFCPETTPYLFVSSGFISSTEKTLELVFLKYETSKLVNFSANCILTKLQMNLYLQTLLHKVLHGLNLSVLFV